MRSKRRRECMIICAGLVSLVFSCTAGCQKRAMIADSEAAVTDDADLSSETVAVAEQPARGGAQLWSENCMRCHNYRSPRERSDREWEIIVHHMRVRGNLTAEEHRLILTFLKAAN